MTRKIAFLGLGIMGSFMSASLSRAGYSVCGWNRTAGRRSLQVAIDAGVKISSNAESAVDGAEFVFFCLGDEQDLRTILLGEGGLAEKALQNDVLIIDMSTSGPHAARNISSALSQTGRGLRFLDAPVSGGDIGARQGTLTIMVGGARQDFEQCLPLLQTMGKNIHYCGTTGSGQSVKLCNQVLCAVNLVAVCESFQLAKDLGIDPQLVVDVCGTGAAGSWALSNLGPKIIQGDFQPAFMIKHMLKDLRLVGESQSRRENALPGTELARQKLEEAARARGGAADEQGTQAMMRAYTSE